MLLKGQENTTDVFTAGRLVEQIPQPEVSLHSVLGTHCEVERAADRVRIKAMHNMRVAEEEVFCAVAECFKLSFFAQKDAVLHDKFIIVHADARRDYGQQDKKDKQSEKESWHKDLELEIDKFRLVKIAEEEN